MLNDINGELINLFRVVKHHLDELCRQFRWDLVSRQQFTWHKDQPTEQLTDIQRAARFFYLQRTAFGGKVDGQTFGVDAGRPPRLNLLRLEEDLSAAHLRLSRTMIENLPWAECIRRYDKPGTLFYCDPPYWGTAGYGVGFELDQYDQMAELAKTIKGRMIVSVNDIPEMRQAFKGLKFQTADITYTVGGAGKAQKSRELIIST